MRSLGVCLVLTLQAEDQSLTESPRSATFRDDDDNRPALLFLAVRTFWFLVTGTKVTGVFTVCLGLTSTLPVIFWDFCCCCLVWDVSVEDPEPQWASCHPAGLRGTTINVVTFLTDPELFTNSEREREGERESRNQKTSTRLTRLSPQQERIFCKQNMSSQLSDFI